MTTYHEIRPALGTKITLVIVSNAPEQYVRGIFRSLWLQIFEFEKRFSRFLPNSELSQFNRAASTKRHISPAFHDLLVAARTMSILSGELFNPFILPALQRAGYKKSGSCPANPAANPFFLFV